MYALQIQNDRGEIYGLTDHLDEFIVTEITGLDSPRNNINISTAGTQDGGKFNSSHLECRNIVITVVLSGNIEAQRQKLYRIFPIKSAVKVFFMEKYRNLMTEGYIEQISVPQFVKLEVAQISIICPDPYWKDRNEIQAETSYGLAAFAFPFAISAGGVPLSGQYANPVCRIVNNGDCNIGFVSRITIDTEQEATITRQTTSFTVSSILSRRVLLPLSASEYDESTEHLRVKINDSVIEPSRYTTKYITYFERTGTPRFIYIQFENGTLSVGDAVKIEVYHTGSGYVQEVSEQSDEPFVLPDSLRCTFTKPSWYSSAINIDYTIIQDGSDTTNNWTLDDTEDLAFTTDNMSLRHEAHLTLTGDVWRENIDIVTVEKQTTVGYPDELFSDLIPVTSAVRLYQGETKLTDWTSEIVDISDGTQETCFAFRWVLTDNVTEYTYTDTGGADISGYTDEQLDTGMGVVDDLTITNTSTGAHICFAGIPLRSGDAIELSTMPGDLHATVMKSDWMPVGISLLYTVYQHGSFFRLQKGENILEITAETNVDFVRAEFRARQLFGGV